MKVTRTNPVKRIILCADDYGQNTAISQAIIELINKKRLSATSCLATFLDWEEHAEWLRTLERPVDIGLHFNLTEGKPLLPEFKEVYQDDFFSLPKLMLLAFSKRLHPRVIELEFYMQLERFISSLGRIPDFIDGHQHIHQFPIVRDAILRVYEKHLRKYGTYIRSVYKKTSFINFKEKIIQLSGARKFRKQLIKRQIPRNTSFSGIYNFKNAKNYSKLFPQYLKESLDGGLIMCHPGLGSDDKTDAISEARCKEYLYLLSDQFLRDCFAEKVMLVRFKNLKMS